MMARTAGSGGSRSIAPVAALIGVFLALVLPAVAQADEAPGVIVRYRAGTSAAERLDTRRNADVTRAESLPVARAEVVEPDIGVTDAAAIRALASDPDVLYAEPNGTRHALATTNDSLFGQEWALQNTGQGVTGADFNNGSLGGGAAPAPGADINALGAWDLSTGDPSVVVGVVDTGIDATRPDLGANVWTNSRPGTSGIQNVSGDVHGWDFIQNDNTPADVTSANNPGHGTHVSGILGARGNDGGGIAGVSWNTSIMPVRSLDQNGSGTLAQVIDGYTYAAREGARIVNASLGDYAPSDTERSAIAAATSTLFIVAAGNDGGDNDTLTEGDCARLTNLGQSPPPCSFPCNYDLANILCVAATDRADNLASFSNFGANEVDLAAPGTDILSTVPTSSLEPQPLAPGFALLSGTSMATPEVSGVAALLLARHPNLTVAQLKQALMQGVDKLPQLDGKVASGGRIDALSALQASDAIASPPPPPPPPPAPIAVQSSVPARDTAAPLLVLNLGRKARIKTLLSRGLKVAVHCSEGCRLTYRLLVDAKTAKRLHIRRTAATRRHTLTRAATDSASLKLPKALRRVRSAQLTLEVTAVDSAGNAVTRKVTVALRR
jgi:subtilisin family serine protease